MKGKIYCLTSPSGKSYIGQTTRKLSKRMYEHQNKPECLLIYNAIHKYKLENFRYQILFESNDVDALDDMEIFYIKYRNTLAPNGYNVRTGGAKGSRHCQESRERMKLSKLGEKNPNFGKPRTEQTKMRISLAKKGSKHHFYGKQLSYEHKLNLSKARKKDDLSMYLVKVKANPKYYQGGGYAVSNHPVLKNKWFTSKKLSDQEKLQLATDYLNSANGYDIGSETKRFPVDSSHKTKKIVLNYRLKI